MSRAASTLLVAALAIVTLPAQAQDKPIFSLPLSGAFFTVSRDKATATASLSRFLGQRFFSEIDFSASTGDGGDVALATSSGLAAGLDLAISIQYDRRHDWLGRAASSYQRYQYLCKKPPGQACTSEEIGKAALSLSPIPDGTDFYWSAGLTWRVHYDQVMAFAHLEDGSASNFSKVTASAGATFTGYFAPAFALKLDGGYTYGHLPDVMGVHRCVAVPSMDPTISGQSCADTQLIVGPTINRHLGYAHASVVYLAPLASDSNHPPGAEIDVFADDLGGAAHLDARALFFITPSRGAIYTRTGVGISVSTALTDASDGSYRAGHLLGITPFAFVGANF